MNTYKADKIEEYLEPSKALERVISIKANLNKNSSEADCLEMIEKRAFDIIVPGADTMR